jgi:hypothetical protein
VSTIIAPVVTQTAGFLHEEAERERLRAKTAGPAAASITGQKRYLR